MFVTVSQTQVKTSADLTDSKVFKILNVHFRFYTGNMQQYQNVQNEQN